MKTTKLTYNPTHEKTQHSDTQEKDAQRLHSYSQQHPSLNKEEESERQQRTASARGLTFYINNKLVVYGLY